MRLCAVAQQGLKKVSPASSRTSSPNKRLGLFAVRRLPVVNADTPAALTRSPTDFWGVSARLQEQEVLDSTKQLKKGSRPAPSGPSSKLGGARITRRLQSCQFPGAPSLESSRPPGPGQAWKFRKALGSPHFAKQRDETILSVREEGLRAPLVGQGSGSGRRLLRSRSDFIPVPRFVRARVRMGQIHNKQTHLPSCGLTVNVGNFSFCRQPHRERVVGRMHRRAHREAQSSFAQTVSCCRV